MAKSKVIHCRVTDDQHKTIAELAQSNGVSITEYVTRAALAEKKD